MKEQLAFVLMTFLICCFGRGLLEDFMRILLVHNFYGSASPSGENIAFEAERGLLERRGHEVEEFTRHSDEIRKLGLWGTLRGALATPWNPFASRAICRLVERFNPDVVHVHNTFPLISPAIFNAIGVRAPRVLTLHNYRLFCSSAIPLRDGRICTDCLDRRSIFPALRYGCYRGSRLATFPLAVNVGLHRALGTWQKQVDAFIALSAFQRERMVEAGLPRRKFHVKPNFYKGNPQPIPWSDRPGYAIFVGRLSIEKGVGNLLKAWSMWGEQAPELRLIGDGPLRSQLERQASGMPVRFLGQITSVQAQAEIASANILLLPSEWFEGFPMVLREAFAFGTPVAVSRLGPLPSIVLHKKNGLVFEPADPNSLFRTVRSAWESPNFLEGIAQGARNSFETLYNEDANYKNLMQIYGDAKVESEQKKL